MTNKQYDTLKMVALIVAPLIVFCSTLLSVWDVPYTLQITKSLAAVDVLVGSIVQIANMIHKGE